MSAGREQAGRVPRGHALEGKTETGAGYGWEGAMAPYGPL